MSAPVYISGRGLITACGLGCHDFFSAIKNGQSGLKKLTLFSSPRCGHFPVGQITLNVAEISGHNGSRSEQLALIAAREAIQSTGLKPQDLARAAVVTGACTGGMRTSEELVAEILAGQEIDYRDFKYHECANISALLAQELNLGGPQLTLSTACTSGAMAIAVGADLIKSGQAEVVLCGGVDSLTRLTLNGFASLLVVSPDGPKPFDAQRQGMSLAEGAAYVVLESAEHLLARGGRALACLAGYGVTCDAHHATAPHPEGAGAAAAIEAALKMAGVSAEQVDYINAHGTGTHDNDRSEALAITKVFSKIPAVSSTKAFYGHPLAASGAIEAVLATLAITEGFVPANLGLHQVDPEVSFSPPTAGFSGNVSCVMSNSFGFGGNNTVLLIKKAANVTITGENHPAICRFSLKAADALYPEKAPSSFVFPEWLNGFRATAHQISGTPWRQILPPAKLRRLGRVQCAALSATQLVINQHQLTDPEAAVLVATGLGEHMETAAFVENMVRQHEETPMPAKFINSVHNSLAGQMAIWYGLKGANHTFTHNRLSVTAALWQAAVLLEQKRCQEALVVAADTLSPYGLIAGEKLGHFDQKHPAGEGAAAFLALPENRLMPVVEVHWDFLESYLNGADLLLVQDKETLPAALPAGLKVSFWEEEFGLFMTADGLALATAYREIMAGTIKKAVIIQKFAGQKSTIILSA